MHILGIIGGLGPESTIDYYRSIISLHRELRHDNRAPSILINSIDLGRLLQMAGDDDLGGLTRYLLKAVTRLADAGAGFALLAGNTPHLVFERLAAKSPIPLLSIVEATCSEAKAQGLQRCALIGTKFTMAGRFYPEIFERQRVAIVPPNAEEQQLVHDIYVNELLRGVVKNGSRRALVELITRMQQREQIDSVILGGSAFQQILKDAQYDGVTPLDTTQIHVRAAVERMIQ